MELRNTLESTLGCCTLLCLSSFGEKSNGANWNPMSENGYSWDKFLKELRSAITKHDDRAGYGKVSVNGAIIATSSSTQPKAKENLERFGFTMVMDYKTKKYSKPKGDGHGVSEDYTMYIWLMKCPDFLARLKELEAAEAEESKEAA